MFQTHGFWEEIVSEIERQKKNQLQNWLGKTYF